MISKPRSLPDPKLRRDLSNYSFVLAKIDKGDADVEAGRIFTMDEVASSTQAIIDKIRHSFVGSPVTKS